MATATLKITVPVFNFDIIQGQDLILPVKYETIGITDTLLGADLKMEVRLPDYSRVIDTLSIENDRIIKVSENNFTMSFPSSITSLYKMTAATLSLIYGMELTTGGITKRIFEGTIIVKREQTKI